jgi:hypothetical protein
LEQDETRQDKTRRDETGRDGTFDSPCPRLLVRLVPPSLLTTVARRPETSLLALERTLTNDESVLDSSVAISGCLAVLTLMFPRRVLMLVMASLRTVPTWDLSWVWELL